MPSSSPLEAGQAAMLSGERRQRASGRRRSAPSPEHGTSARTRSNAPGRQAGAVPSADHDRRRQGARRRPGRTSRARCSAQLGGEQPGARQREASPASSRALPPGPAHRSSHRGIGRPGAAASARASASAASWLASSCTPARPCATAGICGRVALGEVAAERRPAGRAQPRRDELGRVGQPGHGAQRDPRALAVGGQHGLGLGERRRPGPRPAPRDQRVTIQRGWL